MKPASGFLGKVRSLVSGRRPVPWLVNLGCGGCFHPDWVNFDFVSQSPEVIQHDLRERLPLDDGSCAVVYHSHVLEHLPRPAAPHFLRECNRLLAPGGLLRILVPDLETIARLYLENLKGAMAGDGLAARRHEWMTLELMDQMVRDESGGEMLKYWQLNPMPAEEFVIERTGREVLRVIEPYRARMVSDAPPPPSSRQSPKPDAIARFRASGEVHKWMYDRCSLRALLQETGFHEIKVCDAGESRIPNFARYGLDLDADGAARKPDSLFMEASKH